MRRPRIRHAKWGKVRSRPKRAATRFGPDLRAGERHRRLRRFEFRELPDDMNRIGKEESQYYVLAYLPANLLQPGALTPIKVAVDRGGASVRARTSYCDTVTPGVVTGTPTERDLEARLNANATPTVQAHDADALFLCGSEYRSGGPGARYSWCGNKIRKRQRQILGCPEYHRHPPICPIAAWLRGSTTPRRSSGRSAAGRRIRIPAIPLRKAVRNGSGHVRSEGGVQFGGVASFGKSRHS